MLSSLVDTLAGQFELGVDPNITRYDDTVRVYSSHAAQNEADESWLGKFHKKDEGEAIKRAIEASIKVSHQDFVDITRLSFALNKSACKEGRGLEDFAIGPEDSDHHLPVR